MLFNFINETKTMGKMNKWIPHSRHWSSYPKIKTEQKIVHFKKEYSLSHEYKACYMIIESVTWFQNIFTEVETFNGKYR